MLQAEHSPTGSHWMRIFPMKLNERIFNVADLEYLVKCYNY